MRRDAPAGELMASFFDRALAVYFAGGLALVFTQADRYLWGRGWLPLRPTVLFFLLIGPLAALVLVRAAARREAASEALGLLTANLGLAAPFAALAAFNLLSSLHPTANWSGKATYILLVPYDFLVFLVSMLLPLLPPVRRAIPAAGRLCVLLLALSVYWDALFPGSFSRIASRAAGLARDPNQAAFLMVLALALCLSFGRLLRRDLLLLGMTAVALVGTLSRAGVLLFASLLLVYAVAAALTAGWRTAVLRILVPLGVAAGLVGVGLVVAVSLGERGEGIFSLQANQERLDMFTGKESFLAGRNERLDLVVTFMEKVLEAPVVGHGAGYTYTQPQGPHNRYLQEWVNAGLGGVLSYVGFLAAAAWTFRRRGFAPGLAATLTVAVGSFFSHGILEQRAVPVSLGLLAAASWWATAAVGARARPPAEAALPVAEPAV